MFWVIQENIKREAGHEDLMQGLRDEGCPHALVTLIPFSHEMMPKIALELNSGEIEYRLASESDPHFPNNGSRQIVVMGSISMSEAAQERNWTPGAWLNDNFDQRVWLEKFGNHCLNHDAKFTTLVQIAAFTGQRFIRPVDDLKSMAGSVVDWEWVQTQQGHLGTVSTRWKPGRRVLCADTPISMASVKDIDCQARFFVVAGRIVAGSWYFLGLSRVSQRINIKNVPWSDAGVVEFAQSMVDLWSPAPAFVLDIGHEPDGRFCVIEINCLNHSGYYHCDMKSVVAAMERELG